MIYDVILDLLESACSFAICCHQPRIWSNVEEKKKFFDLCNSFHCADGNFHYSRRNLHAKSKAVCRVRGSLVWSSSIFTISHCSFHTHYLTWSNPSIRVFFRILYYILYHILQHGSGMLVK